MLRPIATLVVAALFAPALSAQSSAAVTRPVAATAPVWKVDVSHSELTFEIRHLVSRVRGTFDQWEATLRGDPSDWRNGGVDVVIQTASINTKHERRDNHLRTNDFFDAPTNPTITFSSRRVEVAGENVTVHGDLTLRGVTRPVVLTGKTLGATTERSGKRRVGFEAETRVNRLDYGVQWNRAAEGGGAVLGDEVRIVIAIAAVEQ